SDYGNLCGDGALQARTIRDPPGCRRCRRAGDARARITRARHIARHVADDLSGRRRLPRARPQRRSHDRHRPAHRGAPPARRRQSRLRRLLAGDLERPPAPAALMTARYFLAIALAGIAIATAIDLARLARGWNEELAIESPLA